MTNKGQKGSVHEEAPTPRWMKHLKVTPTPQNKSPITFSRTGALKKRIFPTTTSTRCMEYLIEHTNSLTKELKAPTSMRKDNVGVLQDQRKSSTTVLMDSHSGLANVNEPETVTRGDLNENGCPPKKNTQKQTRGLKLINQPMGFKRKVIIHEDRIIATDSMEACPRTQIIALWRHYAAGPYAHWRETPEEKKNNLWNAYKDLFEFNVGEEKAKQVFFEFCAQNFPNWMFRLRKKYFLPCRTFSECMRMLPDHMEPADWKVLVDYWSSADFQKRSSINKQNRSKSELQHAAGTHPFALRRYKNEVEGKSNDPLDLWLQNYTKRDSTFVNKRSQEIYEKVQSKKVEALAQGVMTYDENLGFREVCGPPKSGKVIGYGRGIKPSMIFSSSKGQAASEESKRENDEIKEKVKVLTSEVGEMKELLSVALQALKGNMQQPNNDELQVGAVNEDEDNDGEHMKVVQDD